MFATRDIPMSTLILQYGGIRYKRGERLPKMVDEHNPYGQRLSLCKQWSVNIPKGYENITMYNATMAHKTNHDFKPNTKKDAVS